MNFENFGNKRIFRPKEASVGMLQADAKILLLNEYQPGKHRAEDKGIEIVNRLVEYYDARLRALIPLIASRDAAEFLLFQYDEANEILHGIGIDDKREKSRWSEIEASFRRAIKYMVELMCIVQRTGPPRINKALNLIAMENALTCAESVVNLAEMSQRLFSLVAECGHVFLYDETDSRILDVGVTGNHSGYDVRFQKRIIRDRNARSSFMGEEPQFDIHTDLHAQYLDSSFKSEFKMSYAEFIASIAAVINGAKPLSIGAFPILFVNRKKVLESLARLGGSVHGAEIVLKGFTVTHEMLVSENRVIWNPKQKSRAFTRGFFSFPHENGEHIVFSRTMAQESMIHLVSGVCFQKLPPEWRTGKTEQPLLALSNAAGKWFEGIVEMNLTDLGYLGGRAKDYVRGAADSLKIPAEVGEIDYLGINHETKELLLVEAKMTQTGLEAKYWQDDVDRFCRRDKSYAKKFTKKSNG